MHAAKPTPPLHLASHVRARECGGQVVLLDLRSNRYVGIGRTASVALSHCVGGWPSVAEGTIAETVPSGSIEIRTMAQRFLSQGLLSCTAPTRPLDIPLAIADASLDFEDLSTPIEFGAQRVARFLRGAAFASCRLRFQSLDTIARAVSERRLRQHGAHGNSLAIPASMRVSAIAYERLRPFLFTARKKCLFDSLSVLEFLASENLFPHWVIGVKTAPFGAHAWVQYGSLVLNDQHARVRQFRPILVA